MTLEGAVQVRGCWGTESTSQTPHGNSEIFFLLHDDIIIAVIN